jgi:homoaconitate hydratase
VNARLEDLAEAAQVVAGRRVADGVELYVAAASANVQRQAEEQGHWQALLEAGAIPLPSGCGPCIGLGRGTLEPGEVAISATNRNFKGRMGSRDARAYLASPAVVAASAIAGYICAPDRFETIEPRIAIESHPRPARTGGGRIVEGFPERLTGRALWLPVDNLNTDGIYAGTLTYRDDVTEAEMAAAAMANYDPKFNEIARPGDIIVAGRNFGTGSSREQAATCLKLRGIPCVIAASFSETYKRKLPPGLRGTRGGDRGRPRDHHRLPSVDDHRRGGVLRLPPAQPGGPGARRRRRRRGPGQGEDSGVKGGKQKSRKAKSKKVKSKNRNCVAGASG